MSDPLAGWRGLARRSAMAMLVAAPLALLVAAGFSIQGTGEGRPPGVLALAGDYRAYVDAAWFHVPGPAFIFVLAAIAASAGGVPARRRTELAYLFALPVPRWRWVLTHLGWSAAAVAVAGLVCAAILLAGGWWQGHRYPPLAMFARSAAVVLATAPWIVGTTALTTLVRRPTLAIGLAVAVLMFLPGGGFGLQIPAVPETAMPGQWNPWSVADPRMWAGSPPVRALLANAAVTLAAAAAAVLRFERMEV